MGNELGDQTAGKIAALLALGILSRNDGAENGEFEIYRIAGPGYEGHDGNLGEPRRSNGSIETKLHLGNLIRWIVKKGGFEKRIDIAASWFVGLTAPDDASAREREPFFSFVSPIKLRLSRAMRQRRQTTSKVNHSSSTCFSHTHYEQH